MTEPAALQKLLTWLSPAFPVGAFAWSAGLETAIAGRRVLDAAALDNWIAGGLAHGGLRTDAMVLAHAWRSARGHPLHHPSDGPPPPLRGRGTRAPSVAVENPPPFTGEGDRRMAVEEAATLAELADLTDLALALTPAAERQKETLLTGTAFVIAARAWPSDIYATLPDPCPYPIAVGAIAAAHGIGLDDTLLGFLTAAVHSQVSVAVRLVPLGQSDGLKVMAALEPRIASLAKAAATASLDDIGGIAYAADIAQMRHETLEPRIFRS